LLHAERGEPCALGDSAACAARIIVVFYDSGGSNGGFHARTLPPCFGYSHLVLEAAGEDTKMADHLSPIFRPAFPSSVIISERSSPSRVRYAAPNNGAPLTAPGRSGQHF
jgi:hypothetical protein